MGEEGGKIGESEVVGLKEYIIPELGIKIIDSSGTFDPNKHVVCGICHSYYTGLQFHLKNIHKMTIKEYLIQFPKAQVHSKEKQEKKNKLIGEFDPYKHVMCMICQEYHSTIHSHIRNLHNMTIDEYRLKFPEAQIESKELKEKRSNSIWKSWDENEERRDQFSKFFKENNPMYNQESYKKQCKTRKEQGNLRQQLGKCNFDGVPCKNPYCAGKIHIDMSGENNSIAIKLKNDPEYSKVLSERLKNTEGMGFKEGCIRDGKTTCPNCNKVHKDFTGENSPFGWPEIAKMNAEEREGHTFTGTPCPKCGVVHKDMSDTMRQIRIKQDPIYRSRPEQVVHKHLEKIGVKHHHNVSVKGLLHPTEEFPHLHMHPFDIVMEDLKTIVEVLGCYWHLCPICHPDIVEELNEDPHKFEVDFLLNKRKDAEIKRQVEVVGWNYEGIWEHEIREIIDEYSDEMYKEDNDKKDEEVDEVVPLC